MNILSESFLGLVAILCNRLWSVVTSESLACKEAAAKRQQPCLLEKMLAKSWRAERITLTTGYLKHYDDVYTSFARGSASPCDEQDE